MEPRQIKLEIEERRDKIARLKKTLSRATCDGFTYSLEEDVHVMEEIERLEEEISSLERRLGRSQAGSCG